MEQMIDKYVDVHRHAPELCVTVLGLPMDARDDVVHFWWVSSEEQCLCIQQLCILFSTFCGPKGRAASQHCQRVQQQGRVLIMGLPTGQDYDHQTAHGGLITPQKAGS